MRKAFARHSQRYGTRRPRAEARAGRAPRAFRPRQPVLGHPLQGLIGPPRGAAKQAPAGQLLRQRRIFLGPL